MSSPPVPDSTTEPLDPRDVLTTHVDMIRRIVRAVARRQRLSACAVEELESAVWMRLVEHDYRAIRQYKGQAAFGTFLTVIVTRLALDVQSAEWGRWRPSTRAKRLGKTAALFETLVFRDGFSLDEATAHLESIGEEKPSRAIRALAAKARSMPRRYIPVELVENDLMTSEDASAPLLAVEHRKRARMVGRVLQRAVKALPPEDRLLLQMRHQQGLKVSTIAKVAGEDQKAMYRRLAHLHRHLRQRVEAAGVTHADTQELVGRGDVSWPSLIAREHAAA